MHYLTSQETGMKWYGHFLEYDELLSDSCLSLEHMGIKCGSLTLIALLQTWISK